MVRSQGFSGVCRVIYEERVGSVSGGKDEKHVDLALRTSASGLRRIYEYVVPNLEAHA